MKKLLKALKEKARNCGVNNKENRARKGAYVDCIVQLEAAINYTHSCKSDSELLPSFLYKHEGGLYFKHLEDTDITEQWNEYLKTR